MNVFARIKKLFETQTIIAEKSVPVPAVPHTSNKLGWDLDGHTYYMRDTQFAQTYSNWRNNEAMSTLQLQALSNETARTELLNRNGYVREFALLILVAKRDFTSLSLVIGKMNDYVDKIRLLASKTAIQWLNEADINEVIESLPSLFGLKKQSRADATTVINIASSRLCSAENQTNLIHGIENKNYKIGAICWSLADQLFSWSSYERIFFALKSKDILTKHAMCEEVKNLTRNELTTFIPKLQKVKLMQLRREILLQLLRQNIIDKISCIKLALLDKSCEIRWMGRLWAKDMPGFLFSEYEHTLTGNKSIREVLIALEGLRELNDSKGIELCKTALKHTETSIRMRALESLCKLDKINLKIYLESGMKDDDIRILRTCFHISFCESSFFDFCLLEFIVQSKKDNVEFNIELLRYAGLVMGWQGLAYASLLTYANLDTKNATKNELQSFLRTWSQSQIYLSVTEPEFRRLQNWLNEEELNKLGKIGNEIRFIFKNTENRFKT